MPPLITTGASRSGPRIVVYHQTHYDPTGRFISILPLIQQKTAVTHVIIGAIHLHAGEPFRIHINDNAYDSALFKPLWAECRILQQAGVRVFGMLGGASKGTYSPLDGDRESFETYYGPLATMIKWCKLDGLDLDVEEPMSLPGIVRLIDRLYSDFGPQFIITLAPVAPALKSGDRKHLSGFSYFDLEKALGHRIAWYNVQFYCGWASLESIDDFIEIIEAGFDASRLVVGCSTHPKWGQGWLPDDMLSETLGTIVDVFPTLGGVMGWEYHESFTQREGGGRPWAWAGFMTDVLLKDASTYTARSL